MTREAFEDNLFRIRSQLLGIAASKLPQSEAEDAVQNAVFSAWKHLDQLRNEEAFEAWMKKILLNECTQLLREQKKRKDIDDALKEHTITQIPHNDLKVYEALEEMNQDERDLLILHHEQGYSIQEISESIGKSNDIVKMRLYRARNRLRVILVSLLILLLSMAIAAGTGHLDISWFLSNRRAEYAEISTDSQSEISILYNGRYLAAEASDAIWDLESLKLLITYSLTGANSDIATVHSGNIGVDGERHDHIWIDEQILPVVQWANGRTVYSYYMDGWKLNGSYLSGSEDFLPDGKGEAFFSSLYFDMIDPDEYETLRTKEGTIVLKCEVFVRNHTTGLIVEQSNLTIRVSAPSVQEWRAAYEEYYH